MRTSTCVVAKCMHPSQAVHHAERQTFASRLERQSGKLKWHAAVDKHIGCNGKFSKMC